MTLGHTEMNLNSIGTLLAVVIPPLFVFIFLKKWHRYTNNSFFVVFILYHCAFFER